MTRHVASFEQEPCQACGKVPAVAGDRHSPECAYGVDLDGVLDSDVARLVQLARTRADVTRIRPAQPVELLELLRGPAMLTCDDAASGEPWKVAARLDGTQLVRTVYCGSQAVHTVRTAVELDVAGWPA